MYAKGVQSLRGAPQADTVPDPEGWAPERWIAAVWSQYVELWPRILGLMHRAADISATTEPGTLEHETARKVVDGAAALSKLHAQVQKQVESYAGYLGLGAVPIVPVAAIALAGLVAVIAWSFKRYDALEATLARVDAGTITAGEADSLLRAAGPVPDLSVLGAGSLGIAVGLGLAALLLWQWFRHRDNPDLVLLNPPPGAWSHRVMRLDYIHDDDGEPYRHDFGRGVVMEGLEDGSVRLYNPDRPIWQEF